MPAQVNQSLVDGLCVLQALCAAGSPQGVRPLARRLGMDPVRCNRLLQALVVAGMARQDEQRRYLTAAGIHVLAAMATFGSGLLHRALDPLAALAQDTGATVALGVCHGDAVCYLYHGRPGQSAAQALGHTRLVPVTESSIGQVLSSGQVFACCRHRDGLAEHHSFAHALGDPAFAAVACTHVPLTADHGPIRAALARCVAAIMDAGANGIP